MDAETLAETILRAAGYSDGDIPGPVRTAERLGLAIELVPPTEVWGLGEVDGRVLLVRDDLRERALWFAVGHELAEYHVARWRLRFDTLLAKERFCDQVSAALLGPRAAFAALARRVGPNFAALAARFGLTQTGAALRYGEVVGAPTAVIAPAVVRVRGQPFGWPDERALRRLALLPGVPGLMRAKLDEMNRVALLAMAS